MKELRVAQLNWGPGENVVLDVEAGFGGAGE